MLNELLHPGLVLAALLSVGYGSLYHLWGGRSLQHLLLALAAAAVGFGIGHAVGVAAQLVPFQIGQLHIVEATVMAWLALVLLHLATAPVDQ